jgi:Zn-dependent M16 (insulinase) family peptidase
MNHIILNILIRRREALLKVTQDDIKRVAKQYLEEPVKENKYSTALLGEATNRIAASNGWHINQWGEAVKE